MRSRTTDNLSQHELNAKRRTLCCPHFERHLHSHRHCSRDLPALVKHSHHKTLLQKCINNPAKLRHKCSRTRSNRCTPFGHRSSQRRQHTIHCSPRFCQRYYDHCLRDVPQLRDRTCQLANFHSSRPYTQKVLSLFLQVVSSPRPPLGHHLVSVPPLDATSHK